MSFKKSERPNHPLVIPPKQNMDESIETAEWNARFVGTTPTGLSFSISSLPAAQRRRRQKKEVLRTEREKNCKREKTATERNKYERKTKETRRKEGENKWSYVGRVETYRLKKPLLTVLQK
jgi:hypothetical protein